MKGRRFQIQQSGRETRTDPSQLDTIGKGLPLNSNQATPGRDEEFVQDGPTKFLMHNFGTSWIKEDPKGQHPRPDRESTSIKIARVCKRSQYRLFVS